MKLLISVFCFLTISSKAQLWVPVGDLNRSVNSLFEDSVTDKLYVGGVFTKFNNDTTIGIFSWDGSQGEMVGCGFEWDCLSPIGINNGAPSVSSIIRYHDDIYATGDFTSASGVTLNGLGRWDGLQWNAVGSGLKLENSQGRGFNLRVINDLLYVVGVFDNCAGIPANSIAKFNGENWSAVNNIPVYREFDPNFIYDVAFYNDELYVGGNFYDYTNMGGGIWNIVRYNSAEWVPVDHGLRGGVVIKMLVYHDDLYVSGAFTPEDSPLGPNAHGLAIWDGLEWSSIGGDLYYTNNAPSIIDMLIFHDKLYVCGDLKWQGGVYGESVVYWDGIDWCAITPPESFQYRVKSLASYDDSLYVGGDFQQVQGDTAMAYIAKWVGGDHTEGCGNTTGVKNINTTPAFSIYPNPASSSATLSFTNHKEGTLTLFDVAGRQLMSNVLPQSHDQQFQIDISAFNSGIYFLSWRDEERIYSGKFIKQ